MGCWVRGPREASQASGRGERVCKDGSEVWWLQVTDRRCRRAWQLGIMPGLITSRMVALCCA